MAINHDINSRWVVRTRSRIDPSDLERRQALKRPGENTEVLISSLKKGRSEQKDKEELKLRLPLDFILPTAVRATDLAVEALLGLQSAKERDVPTLESHRNVKIIQVETKYFLEYLKKHAQKRLSFHKLVGNSNLSDEAICNLMTIFKNKYEVTFHAERTNRNLMLTLSDPALDLKAKQPWIVFCREKYRSVY